MKQQFLTPLAALAAVLILGLPSAAQAQSLPYGDVGGPGASSGGADAGADGSSEDAAEDGDAPLGGGGLIKHTGRLRITPYIEAQQVVTAELSPGNELLTYSTLAAGVQANLTGRTPKPGLRYAMSAALAGVATK